MNDDISLIQVSEDTIESKKKTYTALIVDDSPTTLKTAQFMLAREKDIQVFTAEDGLEGLQRFHTESPDLVFLDISMPKINGHKVLKEMLKLNPDCHVYILSGNSYREEIVQSKQEGAKGFICKPFSKSHIDHAIEQWRKETRQI